MHAMHNVIVQVDKDHKRRVCINLKMYSIIAWTSSKVRYYNTFTIYPISPHQDVDSNVDKLKKMD